MGLMDRLKETAQEVAGEARKATVQAQGKLGEAQLRRRMDETARQLGYLVYRERALGTPAGSDADTLVNRIAELDEQITRQQEETRLATKPEPGSPEETTGPPIERTEPGAAPPQSPPEGNPTDQPSS